MGRVTVAGGKVGMAAPSAGIALSTLAEGSVVKLNENGSPVEFYVAKHDYESGLNGVGRTLLVRKNLHSNGTWAGSQRKYQGSVIDTWMNDTYKATLDADVQGAISSTKIYCTTAEGSSASVEAVERDVFALSVTEYGRNDTNARTEGSALSIAASLQRATHERSSAYNNHWTRTNNASNRTQAFYVNTSGNVSLVSSSNSISYRPAFTLPETARFDEETLTFKGVA